MAMLARDLEFDHLCIPFDELAVGELAVGRTGLLAWSDSDTDDSDEDEDAGSEHDGSDDDMPAPSSAVGGQTSQPRGLKSAGELEQENVELKAMLARCRKMLNSMVMSDEGGAVSSEDENCRPDLSPRVVLVLVVVT